MFHMRKFHSVLLVSFFTSYSLCADASVAVQKKSNKGIVVSKKSKQKSVKVNQVNSDKNKTRSVVNKNVKIVNKSVKEENRFYGKVRVGVGYEYQKYAGGDIENLKDTARITPGYDIKRSNQAPVISLGYNLYYKLNNRFALLGGLEAQGRYPVSGSNVVSFYTFDSVQKVKFGEYFRLNTKFGVKTNLNKKLDVETYGIIGMNVATLKTDYANYPEINTSRTNVGFTTGLGADLVIVDKFIVGLEYRYGANKFKNLDEGVNSFKMKTHSVLAKVGYQF